MALGDVASVGVNITMKDGSQPTFLVLHSGTVQLDLDWRISVVFTSADEFDAWLECILEQRAALKRKAVA